MEVFDVLHGGGDFRAVGGQQPVGGIGRGCVSCCEKKTTLLTARLTCAPLVATSVLMSLTVPSACSENVRMLLMATAKLVSVCSFNTTRAQVRDGGVQFFGGFVNPLDEAGRRARDLLQVERLLAGHVRAVGQHRQRCWSVGMTETYWSPRKPDCSMTNRASW